MVSRTRNADVRAAGALARPRRSAAPKAAEPAPDVTIVLPTYLEARGIEAFVGTLRAALERLERPFEILVVDDGSPDGTADRAERALAGGSGRVIRRTGPRSLAGSVIDGFAGARGRVLGVMDADGSHPPDLLAPLLAAIDGGADVAWGARRGPGGGAWRGIGRRLATTTAGLLTTGLVTVSDPMSGFFLVRREAIEGVPLAPLGWKIGLEVLCRGRARRVVEVPYDFAERGTGRSKFGARAILEFMRHVLRLRREAPRTHDPAPPPGRLLPQLALALLVAAVAFFPLAGSLPLTDPDEGLHAVIGRGMAESGDFVTPRIDGKPFLDKPALFFSAVAASFSALGESELAARLPSAVFSLATVLATLLIGRRLLGGRAGLFAAVILATSLLPAMVARGVAPDTGLAFFTTVSIGAFLAAFERRPADPRWLAAGYLAAGLAFLAKGPPGIAVPAVAIVATATLRGDLSRLWREGRPFLGAAIIAAATAPYFAIMASKNPGYLRYFFYERTVLGFFTSSQRHGGEPLYFYVPIVALGLVPWLVFLPHALRGGGLRALERRPGDAAALGWLVSVVLLFSLASSKLPTYVLPAFPAAALLLAGELDRAGRGGLRLPALALAASLGVFAILAPFLGARVLAHRLDPIPPQGVFVTLAALGVVAAVSIALAARRSSTAVVSTIATATLVIGIVALATLVPGIAEQRSARALAEAAAGKVPPGEPILARRVPHSFEFYARRPITEVSKGGLRRAMAGDRPFYLAVGLDRAKTLAKKSHPVATPIARGGELVLFRVDPRGVP